VGEVAIPNNLRVTACPDTFQQKEAIFVSYECLNREKGKLPCFAVKVRTRGEAQIANLLCQKGFDVLVPSFRELRFYSDRTIKVISALFPGYIFVRMDMRDLLRLLSTDGVSYVVRQGAEFEPMPVEQTRAIEALCKGTDDREPCSYLQAGQRVRIESGLFAGIEGVLHTVRDVRRLVINVESLGKSVSVQIGAERIHVLEDTKNFGTPKPLVSWDIPTARLQA
jgi:transcription antitermination factor NusG